MPFLTRKALKRFLRAAASSPSRKDGSYWLDDKKMPLDAIVAEVKKRSGSDANYSVVIRGEKEAAYNDVIHVLDRFKAAGITRFGLAAEQEAGG